MLKENGNHRGESEASSPDGEAPQPPALEDRVIFRLPQDFDIDDVFRSEQELSDEKISVPQEPQHVVTQPVISQSSSEDSWAGAAFVETQPADPQLPTPPPATAATLSVADLIENNVRLEWQEAVAIAQRLCRAAGGDPALSVQRALVEPWNVEITDHGEVRMLAGGPGCDPTVKEVGRILRALLQESIAPVDLRLLASQASFEVPLFGSVEELSKALRHFERPGESEAIQKAFYRGVAAKFSAPAAPARETATIPASTEQPGLATKGVPATPKASPQHQKINRPRLVRVSAIVSLSLAVLMLLTWRLLPAQKPVPSSAEQVVAPAETPSSSDRSPDEALVAPPTREDATPPVATSIERRVEAAPARDAARRATSREIARVLAPPPVLIASAPTRVADAVPDAASRRATELLASGRTQDAALAFDALVMAQPFYQPPPGATPEVLAALRASKQALLPTLGRSRYESARAAFEAGDVDRALADGRIAAIMLKDSDSAPVPDLNAAIEKFLALVSDAKAVEEQRVYTINDPGITPPVALGRQLPGAPPPGVTSFMVGQLEMLIGRSGQVESVKLHTPANRYSERMIVSVAKAWKYRPALRNGKPVRFSLVVSINLPES